ncbi:hypothetical protein IGK74_002309 [Enterococcus sp. AZ150]|uniref:pLS20_p028 family conjugation system transmembrane protein n=1 Tax=Enterococcus sp. AZ150 TaxID=2774866 RepID=UPI003F23DB8A
MDAPFQTFSQLMDKIKSFDGEITGDNAKYVLQFYHYWSNYLTTIPALLAKLVAILGILAKGLYYLISSLEHVFNNLFKLFGLFGYLSDKTTLLGQFYFYLQVLGIAVFTLVLILKASFGLMGKGLKYKNVLTHFALVTCVLAVLPFAITQISTALVKDAQSIQGSSTTTDNSTLALQPIKSNVIDLKVLIDNDFNVEKFPMDKYGFILPTQTGRVATNNITDDSSKRLTNDHISNIDFSATYGATDSDTLDAMDKEHKGLKGLFLHAPNSNADGVNAMTEHRFSQTLNGFEDVYLRYKVNWIGLFAQGLVLVILLTLMALKLVKSVFELVLTAIIAPIQGYSSVDSSKKFKELLLTILSGIAGIFFEVIIMRITLELMRDLPSISLKTISGLSGGFFDGLNMWEQCLTAIIVYLGFFFGSMQGIGIIERWLGVSTSNNETATNLMAGMMMASAMGDGVGATLHAGKGVGRALGKGANVLGNASGKGISKTIEGAKGLSSIGSAAEGVAGGIGSNKESSQTSSFGTNSQERTSDNNMNQTKDTNGINTNQSEKDRQNDSKQTGIYGSKEQNNQNNQNTAQSNQQNNQNSEHASEYGVTNTEGGLNEMSDERVLSDHTLEQEKEINGGIGQNETETPQQTNEDTGGIRQTEGQQQTNENIGGIRQTETSQQANERTGGIRQTETPQQANERTGGIRQTEGQQQTNENIGGIRQTETPRQTNDSKEGIKQTKNVQESSQHSTEVPRTENKQEGGVRETETGTLLNNGNRFNGNKQIPSDYINKEKISDQGVKGNSNVNVQPNNLGQTYDIPYSVKKDNFSSSDYAKPSLDKAKENIKPKKQQDNSFKQAHQKTKSMNTKLQQATQQLRGQQSHIKGSHIDED